MSTSINLKMKAANDKNISQALTYIDPNASNADLKGFAQGLVSLTTNTLQQINKITTEDIDKTYTPLSITLNGSGNITPTISGNTITYSASDCINASTPYTGDGETIRFIGTMITIKAGTTTVPSAGITVDNTYDVNVVYPTIAKGNSDGTTEQISFFVSADNVSEIQGQKFTFTVPAGSSGSVHWDSTTYTVEIV